MAKFYIYTIVWGDDYINMMRQISFPALAAPNNLPAVIDEHDVTVKVLTLSHHAEEIQAWPITQYLQTLTSIEFDTSLDEMMPVGRPDTLSNEKYLMWSDICNRTLKDAHENDAWWIIWSPDSFLADGALSAICKRAQGDYRVISVGCNQVVDRTPFLKELQDTVMQDGQPLVLSNRQLATLAIKHFHPAYAHSTIRFDSFTTWPSVLYFSIPGEGFLVRLFHIAPLAVRLDRLTKIDEGDTIDLMFIEKVVNSVDQIYFANDSDELSAVNLAQSEFSIPTTKEGPSERIIRNFINKHTNSIHRHFALTPCYWHFADVTPEKWAPLEALSENFIKMMNATYDPNFIEDAGFRVPQSES